MAKYQGDIFVKKWNCNADDLQQQGIYDRALEMISQYQRVVEIGCGTGQSTLSILCADHKVFSIDFFDECIAETAYRISDFGYEVVNEITWSDECATLMKADLLTQEVVNGIANLDFDVLVIWNPGQSDNVKLIDRCAEIAKAKDVPLQVIERDFDQIGAKKVLEDIARFNQIRLIDDDYIPVKWNKEGIKLKEMKIDTVIEAIGVYLPS